MKKSSLRHEIAPGESISKLARKYYGDYKKYHHIANFNNMTDATQVRVGQRIMVPVIDGVTIDDLIRISTGTSAPASTPVMEGEYTVHQIQPGESLSKVAQIYYGDYQLFHVIAKYNGICGSHEHQSRTENKSSATGKWCGPVSGASIPARTSGSGPGYALRTRHRRIRPSLRNTGSQRLRRRSRRVRSQ